MSCFIRLQPGHVRLHACNRDHGVYAGVTAPRSAQRAPRATGGARGPGPLLARRTRLAGTLGESQTSDSEAHRILRKSHTPSRVSRERGQSRIARHAFSVCVSCVKLLPHISRAKNEKTQIRRHRRRDMSGYRHVPRHTN